MRRTQAEIKRLLNETKDMSSKDAAKHIGISQGTLYNWKTNKKAVKVSKGTTKKITSKKVLNIVKSLKDKITILEKELAK